MFLFLAKTCLWCLKAMKYLVPYLAYNACSLFLVFTLFNSSPVAFDLSCTHEPYRHAMILHNLARLVLLCKCLLNYLIIFG